MQLTNASGQSVSLLNDDASRAKSRVGGASPSETEQRRHCQQSPPKPPHSRSPSTTTASSSSLHLNNLLHHPSSSPEKGSTTLPRITSHPLPSISSSSSSSITLPSASSLLSHSSVSSSDRHYFDPARSRSSSSTDNRRPSLAKAKASQVQLPFHNSPSSHSFGSSSSSLSSSSSRPKLPSNDSNDSVDSRKSSCSSQLSYGGYTASSSSCASPADQQIDSPVFSPAAGSVPQLLRFNSASSSRAHRTPSPMTPAYPADPLDQHNKNQVPINPLGDGAGYAFNPAASGPYFANHAAFAPVPPTNPGRFLNAAANNTLETNDGFSIPNGAPMYGFTQNLIPGSNAVGVDLVGASQADPNSMAGQVQQASPTSATANGSGANNGVQKARKKYPCPHASKYNCTDTFTTSGHAARHGKKHTGEKNILCPTCKKAFTRKDNMKQHERTHRNDRHSIDGSANKRVKGHATSNSTGNVSLDAAPATSALSATSMDLDIGAIRNSTSGAPARPPVLPMNVAAMPLLDPMNASPINVMPGTIIPPAANFFTDADFAGVEQGPGEPIYNTYSGSTMAKHSGARRHSSNNQRSGIDALIQAAGTVG